MTAPPQVDQVGFGISAIVEVIRNGCEIGAIIIGGAWTYYKFFKGRTYKPRLQCEVHGSIEAHSGQSLLKITINAKNVGLSKVLFDKRATVLQLYPGLPIETSPSQPFSLGWSDHPAVFDVFTEHAAIEPTESIQDQVLVELPDDKAPAYKLVLRVLCGGTWWADKDIVLASEQHRTGGTHEQGSGSNASGTESDSRDPTTERGATTQGRPTP
jgi:hypothetical protein